MDLAAAVFSAAERQRTVGGIERALPEFDRALVRPVVLHLIWTGILIADLTAPSGGGTAVRVAVSS